MPPAGIVPSFDESEEGRAGLGVGLEAPAVEEFAFERGEEALGHGVDAPIKVKGPIERPELISVHGTGSRKSPVPRSA